MSDHPLKKVGLKITPPREAILTVFNDTQAHLSAESIQQTLQQKGLDIGLGTVYRVLSQFESAGLIIKHNFQEDCALFELNRGEHHDHIVCTQCGAVSEFYDDIIEQQQHQQALQLGYELTGHQLILYGRCQQCQANVLTTS